jgi:chromosome partitioning protein
MDIIPSSLELAMSEMELVSIFGREKLLKQHLKQAKSAYDFIIIDCPPAMGMLTINALTASDYLIIPLQAEFLPMKGLQHFMTSMLSVRKSLNSGLKILGILLTHFDQRKNMNQRVAEQLQSMYGDKVFNSHIRTNIALAQAQEKGVDIFSYDKRSHGAEDYANFGKEALNRIN